MLSTTKKIWTYNSLIIAHRTVVTIMGANDYIKEGSFILGGNWDCFLSTESCHRCIANLFIIFLMKGKIIHSVTQEVSMGSLCGWRTNIHTQVLPQWRENPPHCAFESKTEVTSWSSQQPLPGKAILGTGELLGYSPGHSEDSPPPSPQSVALDGRALVTPLLTKFRSVL